MIDLGLQVRYLVQQQWNWWRNVKILLCCFGTTDNKLCFIHFVCASFWENKFRKFLRSITFAKGRLLSKFSDLKLPLVRAAQRHKEMKDKEKLKKQIKDTITHTNTVLRGDCFQNSQTWNCRRLEQHNATKKWRTKKNSKYKQHI